MDFDPFCVSVFQGSFLVIVVLIDGVKAAFELSSSRVLRVSIRPVLETLKMCSNPIRIGGATNTIA